MITNCYPKHREEITMIGEKIAFYREKNNLTQIQLAKHLDVTRACVSQWELNKRTPNIYDCKKIARVLNVSISDILCDELDIKQKDYQYSEKQKNCIDMLMQLDDDLLNLAEVYLSGLCGRADTFTLRKIK